MLEQQQVPLQATYLEHQVPLQDIHHVHFDLEDLAFQKFEEEIVLGNGSASESSIPQVWLYPLSFIEFCCRK